MLGLTLAFKNYLHDALDCSNRTIFIAVSDFKTFRATTIYQAYVGLFLTVVADVHMQSLIKVPWTYEFLFIIMQRISSTQIFL